MSDDEILKFFNSKNKKFRWDKLEFKYPEIYSYLINRFSDASSPKEAFIRIERKLYERPVCNICGKSVKFNQRFATFSKTCSKECQDKLRFLSIKKYNLKHYGVENYYSSEKFKQEQKQKNLKLYGVEYSFQRDDVKEKIKQTCLEKYGVENGGGSKEAQEKIRKTTREHYGVDYSLSSPEVREKGKQTCLEKYGVENGGGSKEAQEKIRKTTREHYGVDYSLSSPEVREKGKQTCLEKYGVDHWAKSEYGKHKLSEILSSEIVQQKINETKRKNHTFNTSKTEKYIESELIKYFDNVKTQYRDIRYPFSCDFYIPELDLFIEYNGTWTHGFHIFNKNDDNDLSKLKYWEEKSIKHPYYKTAIKVWTYGDPLKIKTAKDNNLNYLVFYNLNEFNLWLEKVKTYKENQYQYRIVNEKL